MRWVFVQWVDIAACEHPWISKEDAKALKPATMQTAGAVVVDGKDHMVLAGTVEADESSYGNVNAIPKGVILSVKPMRIEEGALKDERGGV
jgi:hypothetical protein